MNLLITSCVKEFNLMLSFKKNTNNNFFRLKQAIKKCEKLHFYEKNYLDFI